MDAGARIAYIVAEVAAGNGDKYFKERKPEPVKGGDRKWNTPPAKPSGSQGSTEAR